MLQPSQSTDSLLFLGSMLLLIAIFIPMFLWGVRKNVSTIRQLPEFTDSDVATVQRQMIALLVGLPLLLLFFAVARLVVDQPSPGIILIVLLIGFIPLAYIAVSSIRNRVAIGGRIPARGARAVRSGIINLVFLILLFTGFTLYLISLM